MTLLEALSVMTIGVVIWECVKIAIDRWPSHNKARTTSPRKRV
jgi:hypothetical protein